MATIRKISIIGDGAWGTTLSLYLSRKGYDVCLWGAFDEYVRQMAQRRENIKFLPGFKIPQRIHLTSNIHQAVSFGDLIVLSVPSEYLPFVLKKIQKTPYQGKIFTSVIKGIHPRSFKRVSETIEEFLPGVLLVVLSGPTIALEVAQGVPTTAVAACRDEKLARKVQKVFNSHTFRIYTNTDVIGVEIAGSVKNIMALACGICDGLKLGTNAKAAILTRGLAEMTRLGVALGACKETFYGLAGIGDLATTCFSPNSRNRSVGEALGRGQKVKTILSRMNAVAEGVVTTKAVYRLSIKKKILMPIVQQVYKVIFNNKSVSSAMDDLMTRSLKSE